MTCQCGFIGNIIEWIFIKFVTKTHHKGNREIEMYACPSCGTCKVDLRNIKGD